MHILQKMNAVTSVRAHRAVAVRTEDHLDQHPGGQDSRADWPRWQGHPGDPRRVRCLHRRRRRRNGEDRRGRPGFGGHGAAHDRRSSPSPRWARYTRGTCGGSANFGAFVQIIPNQDGLLHVSEIAHRRLERVEDELQMGEIVKVKVLEVQNDGKVRLSRKVLLEKPEGYQEEATQRAPARRSRRREPQQRWRTASRALATVVRCESARWSYAARLTSVILWAGAMFLDVGRG